MSGLGLFWLAQIAGDKPPNILGKGNAKLRGLGLRPPLRLSVHGDLRARIHDGAITPPPGAAAKPGEGPMAKSPHPAQRSLTLACATPGSSRELYT